MIALIDLKKSINDVLKADFPNITLHSNRVDEGYNKPSFFTEIIPLTMYHETINYTSHKQMVVINYFDTNGSELKKLKISDRLMASFGMTLIVAGRHLLCQNIRSEIVDTVLQYRFDLNYMAEVINKEVHEPVGQIEIELIKE